MQEVKILIVDDDEGDRFIIHRMLTKLNLNLVIEEVPSGRDGILAFLNNEFDFVFLDYNLLTMTGSDVLREIELSQMRNTVIISMSNHLEEKRVNEMRSLGASTFVSKDHLTQEGVAEKILDIKPPQHPSDPRWHSLS